VDKPTLRNKAICVLLAGIFFNLAIGVLYAWSVLKSTMTAPEAAGGWAWSSSQAGFPYTLAVVCFALGVLIGGRIQDKTGPRPVVTTGGAMVGLGLILSGFIGNSPTGIALCFGVVTGLGIGLGYSCVTPSALKWYHPSKKGLISGMVLGGFGLGAVYYAPVASALLQRFTIEQTMLFLGMAILLISVPLAQFIKVPPAGYIPAEPANLKPSAAKAPAPDYSWREMMKTRRFYIMIVLYLFSVSVGLMVIGNITAIAELQANITHAALLAGLVSFMAVTNFLGRIAGGILSDKIGRVYALFVIFILQLLNMAGFAFYSNLALIIVGIIFAGMCFGAILAVFPALTADQYGLKNYGQNYGIIYLAYGFSGVVAPLIADYFYDRTGNFNTAYIICAVMMAGVIGINFLLKNELKRNDG
jgi:MFS family permease